MKTLIGAGLLCCAAASVAFEASGWTTVVRDTAPVDIVPLKDGRWRGIGLREMADGQYDAIRIRANVHLARHKAGPAIPMEPLKTVALFKDRLTVSTDSAHAVVIDFHVEDRTDHVPNRYVLNVREVRIEAGAPPSSAPGGDRV